MNVVCDNCGSSDVAKIKIDEYKCERCGHVWFPREYTKDEPKVCLKCKSPYWNIPRKKR